jgi:hypothetical protein
MIAEVAGLRSIALMPRELSRRVATPLCASDEGSARLPCRIASRDRFRERKVPLARRSTLDTRLENPRFLTMGRYLPILAA